MNKQFPDDYKIGPEVPCIGAAFCWNHPAPNRQPDVEIDLPFTTDQYESIAWHEKTWKDFLDLLNESPVEAFKWGSFNMVKEIRIWRK